MLGESLRKRRSDKKRDVKPTIDVNLKDAIYRLSFVTRSPVKEVCEELCLYSLNNRKIRDNISVYMRRDIRLGSTFFNGNKELQQNTDFIESIHNRQKYALIGPCDKLLDYGVVRTIRATPIDNLVELNE